MVNSMDPFPLGAVHTVYMQVRINLLLNSSILFLAVFLQEVTLLNNPFLLYYIMLE